MADQRAFFHGLWTRGKPLLVVLLLCGFPLISVDIAMQYVLGIRENNWIKAKARRLEGKLIRIQPWGDPEIYFKSMFRRSLTRASRGHSPVARLRKLLARMSERFPGLFSFVLFNQENKVAWVSPGFQPSRVLAERLLAGIRRGQSLDWEPLGRGWSLFAAFLGTALPSPQSLIVGSHFVKTSNLPRNTWFLYGLHQKFAVFVQVHQEAYTPFQGLRRLVNLEPRDGIDLCLLDLAHGEVQGFGTKEFLPALWRTSQQFEGRPRSFLRAEGRLWTFLILDTGYRLVASVPDTSKEFTVRVREGYWVTSLAVLGLLLFLTWRVTTGDRLPYLSLRWKLLSFFLLAAGVPLVILGILGNIYLQEQARALTQNAWDEMMATLRDIDQNPSVLHLRIQKEFQDMLAGYRPDDRDPAYQAKMAARFRSCGNRFKLRDFRVVDQDGRTVLQSWGDRKENPADKFTLAIVAESMALLNREVSPVSAGRKAVSESMIGTVTGQGMNQIVDSFIGSLGRISSIEIGPYGSLIYPHFLRNGQNIVTHAFLAAWAPTHLETLLLKLLLVSRTTSDSGTRLLGIRKRPTWLAFPHHLPGAVGGPQTFHKVHFVVGVPPRGKQFRQFWRTLLRTKSPVQSRLEVGSQPTLIAGLPGLNLKEHFLVMTQPVAEVDRQIAGLRRQLWGFGLLSGLFTLVLASLLTSKLLVPVRELGKGMEAIRSKRFDHQIPTQDPDELGDLVTVFNSMMGSLQEMSVGRQVQENLFPREPLICGGVGVFGVSRSATDLGGDYYDYLQVGPDRLLVLVGDVTGHGIPAALVMALSKAVVATLTLTDPDPEKILAILNRVIMDNTRRKLFMSCCLLWIDTRSREVEVFNAGHPYPLLQKPDGVMEEVKAQGVLLGIRRNPPFKRVRLQLRAGERLLLYTDGLFESLAPTGQDGFVPWVTYLKSRPRLPLEEAPADVLDHHPEMLTAHARADDHTFLVVEGRPAGTDA